MHIGYNKRKVKYEMESIILEVVAEGRDLGVTMQSDQEWNKQYTKAVISPYRVLGMINRSFSYLSKDITLQLYKTLDRPHVE